MKALIIGGGIIGCSVAWRLARENAAVTVIERGRIGREASWAAAGMIAPQAEAQSGGPFFDFCVRAREGFEETARMVLAESGVDPEYDDHGIIYLAFNPTDREELEARGRWQIAAGGAVEELSPADARKLEPAVAPGTIYALHLPLDRRTDNRRLTQAYAAAAVAKGAEFVEGTRVDRIIVEHGRASAVRTDDGRLHQADVVINAAGAWAAQVRGLEDDAISSYPVRGQIVCFDARPGMIGPSLFSLRGYIVPRRDGRILAGSTMEEAGYDKSVTLNGIEKITRAAIEMTPSLNELRFREAWAGLRPATRDFLPIIGRSPTVPNVVYATGHFRSGILLSAITGECVADLVFERSPTLLIEPFSPQRFAAAPKVRALGLVRDILFRSRIDAAAQALALDVAYASNLEQAGARVAQAQPAVIFVDLSDASFPAEATAHQMRSAAGSVRLIGFASHVDLKSLTAAREAGFELTLSRSEFTMRLPELLKL